MEREVEKCLEVGARIRAEEGFDWPAPEDAAVEELELAVVVVVVVVELELARKRDWEWFEK